MKLLFQVLVSLFAVSILSACVEEPYKGNVYTSQSYEVQSRSPQSAYQGGQVPSSHSAEVSTQGGMLNGQVMGS